MAIFNFLSLIIENSATLEVFQILQHRLQSVFSNNSISVWNANLMKELSLLLFELIHGLCNPTSDDYILS